MIKGSDRSLIHDQKGQSLVEFALILPLLVLFIIGIFELGRAFFAYISITNAAREAVRMYTFTPDTTTVNEIKLTVKNEIGNDTLVDPTKITNIEITCPAVPIPITLDSELKTCVHGDPIRVTVTYEHYLILGLFFPQPITITRFAEMMKP